MKRIRYQELAHSAMLQLELMRSSGNGPCPTQPQQGQQGQQKQQQQQQQQRKIEIRSDMDTNSIMQLVFNHYLGSSLADSIDRPAW
jgi:hypothetical protein